MKDSIKEIKKHIGKDDLIIGAKRVLQNLKLKRIEKIFVASNPKKDLLEDIEYYSKLTGTPVIKLDMLNEELGAVCKKQFSISFLAILKGKQE